MTGFCASEAAIESAADRLPVASAIETKLCNALYGRGSVGTSDLRFSWVACGAGDVVHAIELTAGDGRSLLLSLTTDIVGLPPVEFDWRSYSGPLRVAAWAASCQPFLDVLSAAVGAELTAVSVLSAAGGHAQAEHEDPAAVRIGFAVTCADGLPVVRGRLRCPPQFAQQILAAYDQPVMASEWPPVPVNLRCVVDELAIATAELMKIEVGAVIMLDNQSLAGREPSVQLMAGTASVAADVEAGRLRLRQPLASNPIRSAVVDV